AERSWSLRPDPRYCPPANVKPFILYCPLNHRRLHSFPTRRSSDLSPVPSWFHFDPSAERLTTTLPLRATEEPSRRLSPWQHAPSREEQGVTNPSHGTKRPPNPCYRMQSVKRGMAYGARALRSRSFRSSLRTGKPSTRAQRRQRADRRREAGFSWKGRQGTRDAHSRNAPEHYPRPRQAAAPAG